jgi:hypothetical protein
MRGWAFVFTAAFSLISGCTSSSDPATAGPDCARLSVNDAACIDYTKTCKVDAECGIKAPACTSDATSSLGYSGGVCENGNCGYTVTATACACANGVCPGGADGMGGAGGAGGMGGMSGAGGQ